MAFDKVFSKIRTFASKLPEIAYLSKKGTPTYYEYQTPKQEVVNSFLRELLQTIANLLENHNAKVTVLKEDNCYKYEITLLEKKGKKTREVSIYGDIFKDKLVINVDLVERKEGKYSISLQTLFIFKKREEKSEVGSIDFAYSLDNTTIIAKNEEVELELVKNKQVALNCSCGAVLAKEVFKPLAGIMANILEKRGKDKEIIKLLSEFFNVA